MDRISLLLVDDNSAFLSVAADFLRAQKELIVGTATGGAEALSRAQALRPQVILIDLFMPGLSGLEAIPLLRAALPEAGIIALTLLDADAYRDAALAVGADGFVPKARLRTDLLPAIRRARQAKRDARIAVPEPGSAER